MKDLQSEACMKMSWTYEVVSTDRKQPATTSYQNHHTTDEQKFFWFCLYYAFQRIVAS